MKTFKAYLTEDVNPGYEGMAGEHNIDDADVKSRLNAIIKGLCDGFTCSVYQHKFEWFITDDKLIHQFENGYTFARV